MVVCNKESVACGLVKSLNAFTKIALVDLNPLPKEAADYPEDFVCVIFVADYHLLRDCIILKNDTKGDPFANESAFSTLSFLQKCIGVAGN